MEQAQTLANTQPEMVAEWGADWRAEAEAIKALDGYTQWHSKVVAILRGWGYSAEDSMELSTNLNHFFTKGWTSTWSAEQMDSMAYYLNPNEEDICVKVNEYR
jgi:hypothetical protein